MPCPTAPIFMTKAFLVPNLQALFIFMYIPYILNSMFCPWLRLSLCLWKSPILSNTCPKKEPHHHLQLPAHFFFSALSTHITQSYKYCLDSKKWAPDHSVTQYVNSSPSKGCPFPKTLGLGNCNNITKHVMLDGAGKEVAPEGTAGSSHSKLRDRPGKHLVASILYTHLIKFSQKSEPE